MRNTTSKAARYAAELAGVCSTQEAAALIGDIGAERVKQFCREGRLAAKRNGRDWVVSRSAAKDLAAIERPTGVSLSTVPSVRQVTPKKRQKKR